MLRNRKPEKKSPYEIVKNARNTQRYTSMDYVKRLFSDYMELHGDRRYADDPAIVAGLGMLGEDCVSFVAIEKGKDAKERQRRNFGAPHPEGYRKALRIMKEAEKFHRPVLCFIDTSGAYCGIGAEERGQGQAIAENLMEMMSLNTPVISIVIGEGGSGGALALAVADKVMMLDSAVYSVISPEGCASILWKDGHKADRAAESLHLTAEDAKQLQIIEESIDDSRVQGKQESAFFRELREKLCRDFAELKTCPELAEQRYQRFRKFQ